MKILDTPVSKRQGWTRMLNSVARLWTVCCLLAAVAIAAGADGFGTDEKVPAASKSVQVGAVPRTIRLEFLLDKARAAKVISLLEPQFKNVKFTLHPALNGFHASGPKQDLLKIRSLIPSLDREPDRDFLQVNYGDLNEVKGLLETLVPEVQYTVDPERTGIFLDGSLAAIELVKETVAELEKPPGIDAMLECQVVDLSPKGWQELCPSWFGPEGVVHGCTTSILRESLIPDVRFRRIEQNQSPVEAVSKAIQDHEIRYFIASESAIGPTLQLLQGSSDATILARPRIGLIEGRLSQVHLGDKFPIVNFDPRAGEFQVQYVEVGLHLEVKATMMKDDNVEIEIKPEVQTLLDLKNNQYPRTSLRRFNTTMLVKGGQTMVIGGLMSEEERLAGSQVPLLNDLPIFGSLFRSAQERSGKEIVVTLTPRVMR
jgi:type II secretory pathway component GspD/PulD (secretin)